jgi:hypothetical protein
LLWLPVAVRPNDCNFLSSSRIASIDELLLSKEIRQIRDALITDALAPMGRNGWRSGALYDFAAPRAPHEARRVARVPAAIWTHCLAVMPVRSTPREI